MLGMDSRDGLYNLIAAYFSDQTLAEGAREMALACEDNEPLCREFLALLQWGIDAATREDLVIIDLLQRAYMGGPNSFAEARTRLERVRDAFEEAYQLELLLDQLFNLLRLYFSDRSLAEGVQGMVHDSEGDPDLRRDFLARIQWGIDTAEREGEAIMDMMRRASMARPESYAAARGKLENLRDAFIIACQLEESTARIRKQRLEELLSAYFGDEGVEEGVRMLVGESGCKDDAFQREIVTTLQSAIDAAEAGDPEIAVILKRSLGGTLEPLSEAILYLREVQTTFVAGLAEAASRR